MEKNYTDDEWGLGGLGLSENLCVLTPEPDLFSDLRDHDVYIPLCPLAEDTLPEVRAKDLQPLSPWPPKLALDLSLGAEDEDKVLLRHSISPLQYEIFKSMPAFRRELAEAQKYIRENGHDFKAKCKLMSNEFLEELYLGFFDQKVSMNTKHDIFKTVTRLAELEPKEEKQTQQNTTQAVQININL